MRAMTTTGARFRPGTSVIADSVIFDSKPVGEHAFIVHLRKALEAAREQQAKCEAPLLAEIASLQAQLAHARGEATRAAEESAQELRERDRVRWLAGVQWDDPSIDKAPIWR